MDTNNAIELKNICKRFGDVFANKNIKSNDMKRITFVIEENADIILKRWQSYFGKEADDEDY